MSDYNAAQDIFLNRNSPLNPSSIEIILKDEESYLLFRKQVSKWFTHTNNKLLVEGLIYALSWKFKPKRKELDNVEFACLPKLSVNFCGLVLLFCYCTSVDVVPVERMGDLLGLIEKLKPKTFETIFIISYDIEQH